MIIDKLVYTNLEKQKIEKIIELYQTLIAEANQVGNAEQALQYFDEEITQRQDIKKQAERRYILSFCNNKAAVLEDVKEILTAVTKEEFETRQDRIRKAIPGHDIIEETLPQVYNFDSEKSKDEAIRILKSANDSAIMLSQKTYNTAMSFLYEILSLQVQVTFYHFEEPYDQKEQEEVQKIFVQLLERKAAEWYEPPTPSDSKKKGTVKRNSFIEHLINTANPTFLTTRQTRAMNDYPTRAKEGDNMNFDIFGNANIADGDYLCNIVEYDKLANLRPSVKQALFLLVSIFTFSGAKSLEDNLSLDDYMTIRELKDKKTARKRFEEDMNLILNSTISYDKERKVTDKDGNVKVYKSRIGGFNLLQDWNWTDSKKNMITFKFTEIFFKILKHSTIMNLPISYYKINSNNNPASCDFLLKISILKNYNIGKDNENIISVDTLLKSTRAIPTKEKVDEMDRNTAARIIEPFERDMNALQEAFDWHYCHPHSGGKELTDEELEKLDFDTFSRLMIKIDWKDYPDQTERLERQAERIAENKEKKKQREKAKSKKKVGK